MSLWNPLFDEAAPSMAAATLEKGRFYERSALPDWLF
jgi:hypothetical protein